MSFDSHVLCGLFDRQVPRKPRLVGGVKGRNINEISFPGSPALWAGSFIWKVFFGGAFSYFLIEKAFAVFGANVRTSSAHRTYQIDRLFPFYRSSKKVSVECFDVLTGGKP